jgi:hypothetical protein
MKKEGCSQPKLATPSCPPSAGHPTFPFSSYFEEKKYKEFIEIDGKNTLN